MKDTVKTTTILLAIVRSTALTAATPPENVATLYGDWSQHQQISLSVPVWSETPEGTKGGWTQGSYGIVSAVRSSGDSFEMRDMDYWGIRFDHVSNFDARWDSGSYANMIGAGGIEFTAAGAINVGNASGATRLKLTASQTWKGPDATGTPAYFSIGHDNYQDFYRASATATVDCATLTIAGNLSAWFTWTNHFGNTEIRVEKPARIRLEKQWNNGVDRIAAPQLNAKKLTLAGDGVMWNAGGTSPEVSARGKVPTLEAEMNARTVAPALALEDGADLAGAGAGWDIPTLEVSGSGESAFTGDWTFRRERTAVSIASGVVLALSGTCGEAEGVSAGFDVTGAGTLKIAKASYALTGSIALALGSTLEVVGGGLLDVPVSGVGCIRISGDSTGATPVPGKYLTDFSGTLEVVSGNVYFESLPAGVTVVTSGTGKVWTDGDIPTCYGDWSVNPVVWTNALGETATPVSYADIVIEKVKGATCNFYGKSVYHGIAQRAARTTNFWISRADFHVGSGGFVFETASDLAFGDTATTPMLTLSADQEWKGPASGSDYATLQIGFPGYAHYGYHRMTLGVDPTVENLKISGRLMAYFSTTNALPSLDIEVAAPAKMILCDTWDVGSKSIGGDAHLGARKLILSGDGDGQLPLGLSNVYYPWAVTGLTTIDTLDASYVAGTLVLKDGADLTASSSVRFDLPGLTVTGSGASVLSGTFDIARASLAIVLEENATLDLAGTIRETQDGTTLAATGSGTVIVRGGYGLTGAISLGADVCLEIADRDSFAVPVVGGKSLVFAETGKTMFVPASVLADFTGETITVTGGTVVFESIPAGVSLVEAGGTAKRASDNTDGTLLVTDAPRSESRISLSSGQKLLVCGSGLTAGTEVELAGGRLEFIRSTTATCPVSVTAASSIGAVADVTGTLAGCVVASNETGNANFDLNLSGAGTVNLSGGGAFSHVNLFVSEGAANLTAGRFVIAYGHWGVYDGVFLGVGGTATVECPRPDTGSYQLYCRSKAGQAAVVEISTGAVVRLYHNVGVMIGRPDTSVANTGTLRLSGGSMDISRGYKIELKFATLELLDGELKSDQCLQVSTEEGSFGRIIWRDGTFKLGDEYQTWVGNPFKTTLGGTQGNLTFHLAGPNARLDLNGVPAFTNVLATADNAGSWTADSDACLTVANGGECVFGRFPDGGSIGVDGCSARLADPADPQVGSVVFRGTGRDIVRVEDGDDAPVEIRVTTGAKWGEGQLEGLLAGNVSFDDGAALRVDLENDGTVVPVEIPGTVVCSGALGVDLVRTGRPLASGDSRLLSAAGGLTGPSSFVALSRTAQRASFAVAGGDLVATAVRAGMCLIFR